MKCFVPGCKSGYGKGREKFCLFAAPSDPQLLHQWRQKIPESKRPLKAKDKICARHFEKHLISDRYFSEHQGIVLLDVKKKPGLRKGAVPTIFEGSLAHVNNAECQEEPEDAAADGQEEVNVATTTHSVGIFDYPETCRDENSKPFLREDSFSWQPGKDLLSKDNSLSVPSKEESAEKSGESRSTDQNGNTHSLSADGNSFSQDLLLHPEKVKLPPSWGHHKVRKFSNTNSWVLLPKQHAGYRILPPAPSSLSYVIRFGIDPAALSAVPKAIAT